MRASSRVGRLFEVSSPITSRAATPAGPRGCRGTCRARCPPSRKGSNRSTKATERADAMPVNLPRNALVKPRARRARHDPEHPDHHRAKLVWKWSMRALSFAFFAAVIWLVVRYASHLKWDEVLAAIQEAPLP